MDKCRACGAQIKMIPTEAGWQSAKPRIMPIDAEPVADGNVVIIPADGAIPPRAKVLKKGEEPPAGALRYVSHFGTCPEAKQFRKRREAAAGPAVGEQASLTGDELRGS